MVNRPFFHARILGSFWSADRSVYRVYAADEDLLFVHLGVHTLDPNHVAHQTAAGMGGGLLPALVGYYQAAKARERLDRIKKALEAADEHVLREFVQEDKKSFALEARDIRALSVERPTFWGKLTAGSDTLAVVKFAHAERGKMSLGLLALDDITTAVAELPRLCGGEAAVHLSWNSF